MNEVDIYKYLKSKGLSDFGVAGLMGNLQAESAMRANNAQDGMTRMSDAEYTAAVDNGSYTNFANDSVGYGLAQWTFSTRKRNLLNFAKRRGDSIGDAKMQLDFLLQEMKADYSTVYRTLETASSVKEASDAVLLKFERPADMSEATKNYRASLGQAFYQKYKGTPAAKEEPPALTYCTVSIPQIMKGSTGMTVKAAQLLLISRNFSCGEAGADGWFGSATEEAAKAFQKACSLRDDGIIGRDTWSLLLK